MSQQIFAARQPIFDRTAQTIGYEILFRSGPENRFTASNADVASATSIGQSAMVFGLDTLVGERLAFVNLTRDALLREYWRVLPPGRAVIELLETIQPDAEVIGACRAMKAAGYTVALDDFVDSPESRPLLEIADMVKVDMRLCGQAFDAKFVSPLRARGLRTLAEKIETPDEHARAIAAGYDLLQGYHYCKPVMIETRDLPPSKLAYLRFMAEVSREDASFERLEEVFLHDAALTVRLLRYLNSAAFGWRHEVPTLRHALALMGLRPLRKWAMLMGVLSLSDEHPPELAITALARARFAETVGLEFGLAQQQLELFLTGMLSLVDVMIGRPLQEVIAQLALPEAVSQTLLHETTPLTGVLDFVTAFERGDWKQVDAMRPRGGLDDGSVSRAYTDSLAWAEATIAA